MTPAAGRIRLTVNDFDLLCRTLGRHLIGGEPSTMRRADRLAAAGYMTPQLAVSDAGWRAVIAAYDDGTARYLALTRVQAEALVAPVSR